MKANIYCLTDPFTDEIKYIGKTRRSLIKRLWGHVSKKETTPNSPKSGWVKSLLERGVYPKIELLEVVDEENWEEEERFYVRYFRFLGVDLLNVTDGGFGAHGTTQSVETKIKRAITNKIRGVDAPKIAAMNAAVRGKKQSEQHRKKLSEIRKRIGTKPDHLAKLIASAREHAKKRQKPIASYDKEGNKIQEYEGLSDAKRKINGNLSCIARSLKQGTTHKGYYWKYI